MIFNNVRRAYGIDVGTHYTKVCVLNDGIPIGFSRLKNTPDLKRVTKNACRLALKDAGLKPSFFTSKNVTGYGAKYISKSANRVPQSRCIAMAASSYLDSKVTVIDAGAIFLNIYSIDSQGIIIDQSENDRCAAGNGSYVEMLADSFGVDLCDISDFVSNATTPYEIKSNCSVFAESEIVSQMNSGRDISEVAAGVFYLIAFKIKALMDQIETFEKLLLVGGLARFDSFVGVVEKVVDSEVVTFDNIPPDFLFAYGAAISR